MGRADCDGLYGSSTKNRIGESGACALAPQVLDRAWRVSIEDLGVSRLQRSPCSTSSADLPGALDEHDARVSQGFEDDRADPARE
jgi:hypothetical protein